MFIVHVNRANTYLYECLLYMQGVTSILQADVHLMGTAIVTDAIEHWLSDEASSVRDAAVQLVGNYLTQQSSDTAVHTDDDDNMTDHSDDERAAVQHNYIELLLNRLGDDGVLVRKCVIRTLKSWLRAHPKDKYTPYICCAFIERASLVQVSMSVINVTHIYSKYGLVCRCSVSAC
jgi:HEAT repeat associated with sister chromatid cohesion